MTLCCIRGVQLPQLPGVVTFGYSRYQVLHDSICNIVEYGYLMVTSITRYCMTLCCRYTWSVVTSVTPRIQHRVMQYLVMLVTKGNHLVTEVTKGN